MKIFILLFVIFFSSGVWTEIAIDKEAPQCNTKTLEWKVYRIQVLGVGDPKPKYEIININVCEDVINGKKR